MGIANSGRKTPGQNASPEEAFTRARRRHAVYPEASAPSIVNTGRLVLLLYLNIAIGYMLMGHF